MFFSFFFFKQKTAYEMRISDWSSDVCSSDLAALGDLEDIGAQERKIDGDQKAEHRKCGRTAPAPQADGDEAGEQGIHDHGDRKSVVEGKSVSVRVDHGGRRIIKQKND